MGLTGTLTGGMTGTNIDRYLPVNDREVPVIDREVPVNDRLFGWFCALKKQKLVRTTFFFVLAVL